jgi:hypothetical protein
LLSFSVVITNLFIEEFIKNNEVESDENTNGDLSKNGTMDNWFIILPLFISLSAIGIQYIYTYDI